MSYCLLYLPGKGCPRHFHLEYLSLFLQHYLEMYLFQFVYLSMIFMVKCYAGVHTSLWLREGFLDTILEMYFKLVPILAVKNNLYWTFTLDIDNIFAIPFAKYYTSPYQGKSPARLVVATPELQWIFNVFPEPIIYVNRILFWNTSMLDCNQVEPTRLIQHLMYAFIDW